MGVRDTETSGKRLRLLRERVGLSAADVCRAAGVTSSELSLWEAEKRAVPRTDRVQKGLSKALGVSSLELHAYLTGGRTLEALVVKKTSALEQAILLDRPDRWALVTLSLARELEADGIVFTVAGWVRQLDVLEREVQQFREKVKASWRATTS